MYSIDLIFFLDELKIKNLIHQSKKFVFRFTFFSSKFNENFKPKFVAFVITVGKLFFSFNNEIKSISFDAGKYKYRGIFIRFLKMGKIHLFFLVNKYT